MGIQTCAVESLPTQKYVSGLLVKSSTERVFIYGTTIDNGPTLLLADSNRTTDTDCYFVGLEKRGDAPDIASQNCTIEDNRPDSPTHNVD